MASSELQALMDAAVDAIVVIDHSGLITAFNHSAERLFGHASADAIGRNVSLLMPDPDRSHHDQYLERYAATGIPHAVGIGREVEALRRDGSVFPAFLSVGRVAGSVPGRFVGIIRDVTSEHQARRTLQAERDRAAAGESAEQAARRLQERLTHISRLTTLGEMAAGIAHELNQPLSAIATYAQACQRLLSLAVPDLEESRLAMCEIAHEALRAGDIIQRLRQLVRSEPNARADLDLNALIGQLVPLIQGDGQLHDVQIKLELDPQLSQVNGDAGQLQQLLLNLVRNSLEALAGSSSPSRQITIRTTALAGSLAEVSICDNGPGVYPHLVNRLFMPFVTTKVEGTGLGLSIGQSIVRAHGGSIGYRPLEPRGACFFVRLPAQEHRL